MRAPKGRHYIYSDKSHLHVQFDDLLWPQLGQYCLSQPDGIASTGKREETRAPAFPHTCSDAFPSVRLREPGPGVSPLLVETVKVQVPHLPRLTWPSNLQPVGYLCSCPVSMELIHWGKVRPSHLVWDRTDLAYLLRSLSEAGASVCLVVGRARFASRRKHPTPHGKQGTERPGEEMQKAPRRPGLVTQGPCHWLDLSLNLSESQVLL